MGLTDSEIRTKVAYDNELSGSFDEELALEEDSESENLVLSALYIVSSSSDSDDDFQTDDNDRVTSRDRTNLSKVPPPANRRRSTCDQLLKAPGITEYTGNIDTPLSAFKLLFDDKMFHIQ